MRHTFFTFLLNLVSLERASEQTVKTLTLEELQQLLLPTETVGLLPYHDRRVTALVWEIKYYANKVAARLGAALLADTCIAIASEQLGQAVLLPVPMHEKRRRTRGHNQTEVLCEAMRPYLEGYVVYAPQALKRTRATPPQRGLQKYVRKNNIAGSMWADPFVLGRTCIVVDDVTTTGATFAEATRALRAAGATSVVCVALAQS